MAWRRGFESPVPGCRSDADSVSAPTPGAAFAELRRCGYCRAPSWRTRTRLGERYQACKAALTGLKTSPRAACLGQDCGRERSPRVQEPFLEPLPPSCLPQGSSRALWDSSRFGGAEVPVVPTWKLSRDRAGGALLETWGDDLVIGRRGGAMQPRIWIWWSGVRLLGTSGAPSGKRALGCCHDLTCTCPSSPRLLEWGWGPLPQACGVLNPHPQACGVREVPTSRLSWDPYDWPCFVGAGGGVPCQDEKGVSFDWEAEHSPG